MTTRSSAEDQALRQRNSLLELVIESIPCGLIVFDEANRHVASNAQLRKMLGLPERLFEQPEVTLESLTHFIAARGDYGPGDPAELVAQRVAQARSGEAVRRDRRAPDGRMLEIRVCHMPNGWHAKTYLDVTEEREAAARLQAGEERLELALQATGLGLWEYSPQQDLVYLSPSWQQILGYAPVARTVPSTELAHLAVGDSTADLRASLIALLKGETSQICIELETVKASGSHIWLQIEAQVAARDANGRALRVVGTTKNITQRKEEERALQAAAEAAEMAKRARADFLATMSHEIRTPLNGVIGLARVLEESELPPREAGYVKLINSCAKALLGMVNDVLDFSKIDGGQMLLEPAPCDLHALVGETGDVFADRARAKAVGFHVSLAPDVPQWVTVDAHRLRQILLNLLGNALKFTGSGGFGLSVSTGHLARQRSLLFAVTDTGIGISPDDLGKLFRRFSQVDASSTRRFQGSGLGLAISRDLAVLMGGDIRVSSAPGTGSTFTVEIPLIEAQATTEPQPAAVPRAVEDSILLVEDNPINQMVAQALLEKLGFTRVTTAENGEEALRLCREQAFALVLMDCQMPVMDGFEATRQLRASGYVMPIVALTAGAVSDDRDRCLACGMNDYLAKPIDAGLLGGALNFWLSAGPGGMPGGSLLR